jgi:purine-nucleoside phosphorylase
VLVVSNAAGGLRRTFRAGDLMVIDDHVNFMFCNPLEGTLEPGDERFPDMSAPYDRGLIAQMRDVARAHGIALVEGVYCGELGPTYETLAEVRMFDRLGVDAVGMSTVPEVIVARAMGMRVLGISCITNMAAGMGTAKLDHREVLEVGLQVAGKFQTLVRELVRVL